MESRHVYGNRSIFYQAQGLPSTPSFTRGVIPPHWDRQAPYVGSNGGRTNAVEQCSLRGISVITVLRRLLILVTFSAALLACAFGQSPPVNNIAGIGYLYPPVAVAPGQLTTVFVTGSVQDGVSVTVTGSPIPVLEVRPGSACSPATLCAAFTGITFLMK
jgi:hypothetical protein